MKGQPEPALFGSPPGKYREYETAGFDRAPAFCHSFAQNCRALVHYRLDSEGKV